MAWTVYQFFLSGLMLVTGSINTLSTKWADTSNGTGDTAYGPKYGKERPFDHPFLQSVGMFLGEFSCLLVFKLCFLIWRRKNDKGQEISQGLARLVDGNQQFSPLVFWPAALCDMCGTTLMYIGLNMTDASSFQMLRGAVIVFTALLSVTFLQRKILRHMWLGILFVILGLVIVGLADFLYHPTSSTLIRNFSSGCFGFFTLSLLLIPMYFIKVGKGGSFITKDPDYRLENAIDAFNQMASNWQIILAQVGNIVSIAFFNFSGISVTRELSATTRMVLDSLRTIVVWVVSVSVWDPFNPIQIPGFILLALGTAVYNGLLNNLFIRILGKIRGREDIGEREPLIN